MATSQNGYTVPCPRVRNFIIPGPGGPVVLPMRDGAAGFVLAHAALWWAEVIEPLAGKVRDDWGGAVRTIRGDETTLSNHASFTACDLNATAHPLGTHTLTAVQRARLAVRLRVVYRGVIRSGAFFHTRTDEMHLEVNADVPAVVRLAERLVGTPRGRRLLAANHMTAAQACIGKPAPGPVEGAAA